MKIAETTSYPHPVLTPWSEDITGANISTIVHFREAEGSNQISIHCEVVMDHPDILALISCGAASFGCFVYCQDTGMRRLQRIGFPAGTHDFAPGALLGRVRIRPMIWAVKATSGYAPSGAHAEFSGSFDLHPGQILALDHEQVIEVTRPPLAPVESIFEIVASAEIRDGEFEVSPEGDRVTIYMSNTTYRLVQTLRQTSDVSRAAVMNSLFVPVVMDLLDQLRDGLDQFARYRWLHPFRARCEMVGVKFDNLDLLNDAQRLLDGPFVQLRLLAEEGDL